MTVTADKHRMKRKYIVASFLLVISVLLFRREKPERGKRSGEIVAVISYGLALFRSRVRGTWRVPQARKRKSAKSMLGIFYVCNSAQGVSAERFCTRLTPQNKTHFDTYVYIHRISEIHWVALFVPLAIRMRVARTVLQNTIKRN